jgi:septal ring factor EnvC (AmiA/AmiB activator)
MAQVRRSHRHTLADELDLDDVDGSLDVLDELLERDYDDYVLLYLTGDRRGMEIMRNPYNVERLYDSLNRLRDEYRRRYAEAADDHERARLASLRRAIDTERREIAAEAKLEREERRTEQAAEREIKALSGVNDRLERARAKQEELRRQIEAAQAATPRALAARELQKIHEREYLALVRKYKRLAEQAGTGERARIDGGGAADPPGSTAPPVPKQMLR